MNVSTGTASGDLQEAFGHGGARSQSVHDADAACPREQPRAQAGGVKPRGTCGSAGAAQEERGARSCAWSRARARAHSRTVV